MSVATPRLNLAACLDREATQPERHEYVRGEGLTMTGASLNHNRVALYLHGLLRAHLRGSPGDVFASDVQPRVDAADLRGCASSGSLLIDFFISRVFSFIYERLPLLLLSDWIGRGPHGAIAGTRTSCGSDDAVAGVTGICTGWQG